MQRQQNKHKVVNCDILEGELCAFVQSLTPLVLQLVSAQCVGEIHYYEMILMEVILLFYFLPRLPGFKFQAL